MALNSRWRLLYMYDCFICTDTYFYRRVTIPCSNMVKLVSSLSLPTHYILTGSGALGILCHALSTTLASSFEMWGRDVTPQHLARSERFRTKQKYSHLFSFDHCCSGNEEDWCQSFVSDFNLLITYLLLPTHLTEHFSNSIVDEHIPYSGSKMSRHVILCMNN